MSAPAAIAARSPTRSSCESVELPLTPGRIWELQR